MMKSKKIYDLESRDLINDLKTAGLFVVVILAVACLFYLER